MTPRRDLRVLTTHPDENLEHTHRLKPTAHPLFALKRELGDDRFPNLHVHGVLDTKLEFHGNRALFVGVKYMGPIVWSGTYQMGTGRIDDLLSVEQIMENFWTTGGFLAELYDQLSEKIVNQMHEQYYRQHPKKHHFKELRAFLNSALLINPPLQRTYL